MSVYKNPNMWSVRGKHVFNVDGQQTDFVRVVYGEIDDYWVDPLDIWMRKTIYEKLMDGTYSVSQTPRRNLLVLDENGDVVKPIELGEFY